MQAGSGWARRLVAAGEEDLDVGVLFLAADHVVVRPGPTTSLTSLKQHLSWVATWLHHEAGLRTGGFAPHERFTLELQHPGERFVLELASDGLRFVGWRYDLRRLRAARAEKLSAA